MRNRVAFFALVVLFAAACNGKDPSIVCDDCAVVPENQAPVAEASGPAKVKLGASVTLDASASSDPDEADEIDFLWADDDKNPINNFLDGVDLQESKITFKADVEGTFTFRVRVRDLLGLEDEATVTFLVDKDVVPDNQFAPAVTAVAVNGKVVLFTTAAPNPTFFAAHGQQLDLEAFGTDEDSDEASLTAAFSSSDTTVDTNQVVAPNMSTDADGFRAVSVQVKLTDPDANQSALKTIYIRYVPKANADLTPNAMLVDCAIGDDATGDGSPAAPYKTIQKAYDEAVAAAVVLADRPDVWVGMGVCTEDPIVIDFDSVAIYGLFDQGAGWLRKVGPEYVSAHAASGDNRKYVGGSILRNPDRTVLMTTSNPGQGAGAIRIDGLTFDASPNNVFAVNLTTPTGEGYEGITIDDNEFIGVVTNSTLAMQAGGGLRVYAGASAGPEILIRRNFFSVGAADDGSRFQAWVSPKAVNGNAGLIRFFSNVFYGAVSMSSAYACNGSQQPFAFCLAQYDEGRPLVERNLFWSEATGASTIVLSTARGKISTWANVFHHAQNPQDLTFVQHTDDETTEPAPDGIFVRNAYPAPSTLAFYSWVRDLTNAGPTGYPTSSKFSCISTDRFGTGTTACTTYESPTPVDMYLLGNVIGPAITYPSARQVWRLTSPSFVDAAASTGTMHAAAYWDFDGRYGFMGADWDIGPFEGSN